MKRTLVVTVGAGLIAAALAIGLGKEAAQAAPAPGSLSRASPSRVFA